MSSNTVTDISGDSLISVGGTTATAAAVPLFDVFAVSLNDNEVCLNVFEFFSAREMISGAGASAAPAAAPGMRLSSG